MASTTTYKRGQVIVVNVPFTGQTGSKPRPAVIVSAAAFHRRLPDVIICPISSQPRYYTTPGPGDHPLKHWSKIGLRHPSTALGTEFDCTYRRTTVRTKGHESGSPILS